MKLEKPEVLESVVSWIIQIEDSTRIDVRTSTAPSRIVRLNSIDGSSVMKSDTELLGNRSIVAMKMYALLSTCIISSVI